MDLLGLFQILRAKIENLSSDPSGLSTGDTGRIWYNTTSNTFKYWNGTSAIDPLARANHTGTQLAATISNFDTQVRTSRLDQMAVPTAAVSFNGQLINSIANGVSSGDAVNKSQLDAVQAIASSAASGVAFKSAARAVATSNITLSGTQTVDGVALVAGDRVLVTAQTTASTNGIYVVAAGAWSRSTDADATGELAPGTQLAITEGATPASSGGNADSIWRLVTDTAITIGTTNQTWERLPGSGSTAYIGGAGLVLTGSTFDVVGGTGITVAADLVSINTSVVRRKIGGTVPTTTGTVNGITVTVSGATVAFAHNLGNPCTIPNFVYGSSPGAGNTQGQPVLPDYTNDAAGNNTTVTFPAAPSANQYVFDLDG